MGSPIRRISSLVAIRSFPSFHSSKPSQKPGENRTDRSREQQDTQDTAQESESKQKTQVVKKTLNPDWDDYFSFDYFFSAKSF